MAEPLKATFFTLKQRDRMVLLPATIAYALIAALIIAAYIGLNWGTLTNFATLFRDQPEALSDDEGLRMFAGMMGLFGWFFLLSFPFFIATAAYEAACLRWMIRGEAPGLFGLTLNADTWRVWGVYWAWLLTQWVVGFVVSMLTFPFMFMMLGDLAAQGGSAPDPNSAEMLGLQIKMQGLQALQYIPLAFLGVRLGPAAATSIARKQFSFFEAWNVTRDRFLALFGSYALLWLIFAIAYVALFATAQYFVFGSFLTDLMQTWPEPPADTFERYAEIFASPSTWLYVGAAYAAGLVLSLTYTVFTYGINARAVLVAIEEGKTTVPEQAHG
jgi:hypothetical protein